MIQLNSNPAEAIEKRKLFLVLLGIAGLLNGGFTAYFYSQESLVSIVGICFSLIAISLIYFWIYHDSRARNYKTPKLTRYLIILIGIIGVPIYFWQTRNLKDFCLNLGGLWLFLFYSIAYYVSFYLTVFALTKLGDYS